MDAWQRTKAHLKACGHLAYAPGEHVGVCKTPYIVLHEGGTVRMIESRHVGYATLNVICYVPLGRYEDMVPMAARVRADMRALAPQVRPTGYMGPTIIEEEYKAHSKTLEYQTQKRL